MLLTPIVFLIYNRPHLTETVFCEIARAEPTTLIVIADGPKLPEEAEKCNRAREVIRKITWDCDVITKYSDRHLGCRTSISTGLDWVFEEFEEAIILEDDCLPNQSFFRFCTELLEKYSEDERVMMISGNNFQFGKSRGESSYYFSRFPHVWGWATWRRAWQYYDKSLELWTDLRKSEWLIDVLGDKKYATYWKNVFDKVHKNLIDSWAYRWVFSCWLQNGLVTIPNVNLVSNIGFGIEATHTKESGSRLANLPALDMTFPLVHPPYMIRDFSADCFTSRHLYNPDHGKTDRINAILKRIAGSVLTSRLRRDDHIK